MTNGNGITREIVAKLWNLCNLLRDDGITYTDYVTELTFLLFLKMLAETGHEERLPKEHRWAGLLKREGIDLLEYYRQLLLDLGNPKKTKDQWFLQSSPMLKQSSGSLPIWRLSSGQSTSSIGSPPEKKGLGISTKVCWRKMRQRRSPGQGSTSPLAL